MKKYQDGGKTGAQLKKEGMAMKAAGKAMKAKGAAMKYDANKSKRESYMLQSGADDRAGNITQSMKTGGATKKYQNGGMTGAEMKAKGMAMKAKGEGMKLKGQGQAMKVEGKKMQAEGDVLKYAGQNPVRTKISKSLGLPLQSRPTGIAGTYMKTGGMVNSNAKISALKSAGSKGVKSGVNPKVAASKVAKGRVGGTSTAPKTASPKMKMGGAMKRKSC